MVELMTVIVAQETASKYNIDMNLVDNTRAVTREGEVPKYIYREVIHKLEHCALNDMSVWIQSLAVSICGGHEQDTLFALP